MTVYEEKNELVIELDERIEHSNAGEVEEAIFEAVSSHPGLPLCLDAEKLVYISSAGLRIMIKLRKACTEGFLIRNVSLEVYEIFDTTGLNQIIRIQKKQRRIDVEGLEIIGKGASGTVYRLDEETAVKVYHGGEEVLPVIEEEKEKARQAFLSGIPTAIPFDIVRVGNGYGTVFEMIDARNLNEIIKNDPSCLTQIIPKYADLLRHLHSLEAFEGHLPGAGALYLEALEVFAPFLSEKIFMRIRELLEGLPEVRNILHGDIQVKNVILSGDEMILIDMDHMCAGNPVFEFASLYATYIAFNEVDPSDTLRFLGLDQKTCTRLFDDTLREYLCDPDEETLRRAETKIRIAGYLRLLTILIIERKEEESKKKDVCIRHAAKRLEELVFTTDTLGI